MARELEAAAIDSVPAVLARAPQHPLPVGAPCPNCGTALAGPWCQACGQSSDDFHRSLVKLAGETLEGLFELDSRLWRTLPDLALRPARLTRRYLDGHRVAQIPPFRLFLIVVVLVFLAAGLGTAAQAGHRPRRGIQAGRRAGCQSRRRAWGEGQRSACSIWSARPTPATDG